MKRIVTILGARPQFIKASVVSKAFEQTGKLQEIVVHTGQHFDSNMSEVFFKELGINTPKYNLQIGGGRHGGGWELHVVAEGESGQLTESVL